MSMGKQNLEEKKYLCELSGSKFYSVTSSTVILKNYVIFFFHQKWIYQVLEINSIVKTFKLHVMFLLLQQQTNMFGVTYNYFLTSSCMILKKKSRILKKT